MILLIACSAKIASTSISASPSTSSFISILFDLISPLRVGEFSTFFIKRLTLIFSTLSSASLRSSFDKSKMRLTSKSMRLFASKIFLIKCVLCSSSIGSNKVSAVKRIPVIGDLISCAMIEINSSIYSLSSSSARSFSMAFDKSANSACRILGEATFSPLDRLVVYLINFLVERDTIRLMPNPNNNEIKKITIA